MPVQPLPITADNAAAPVGAPKTDFRADFRHVESWIFDLDNTLYPVNNAYFSQIERRMELFIRENLGYRKDEARALREDCFRAHGTTLNGLMHTHGIDPEDFLGFIHEVDLGMLQADARLHPTISQLPGRRFVFTNGCARHAERVVAHLGLAGLFDDIWDIRTIGFTPKPAASAYEVVIARACIAPARTAMFEDIAANLQVPHELGMTTIWLCDNGKGAHEQTHYCTSDLSTFLQSIEVKQTI